MSRARHVACLAGALLGASANATPAFAEKADNSLRFAAQGTLPGLDKYFNGGPTAVMVSDAVWDTLIYYDPDTGTYKGDLATAWRWIDDTTLELDLREGVKFHNGAPFNADDVVYTLNFASNPENQVRFTRLATWVAHVEKISAYKVRIHTKAPFPAAIGSLASADNPIYPHAYYAAVGPKGMSEKPIGTGPYRVVDQALGKYVRFERNREYFKDSPKPQPTIDKIEIRFIPDPQTRVAEAIAGSLDIIMDIGRDQAEQLRGVRNLQVLSGETGGTVVLRMTTLERAAAPQLRDIRVRQAIMHAIDRETMAKHMLGENARVLHAPCHPVEFGCEEGAVPRYAYDPFKARRLLAEAGFERGFDIDLYAYGDRSPVEAIIGYLREVGIRARMRLLQTAAVTTARRAGRVALSQTMWFSQPLDVSDELSVYHEFAADDVNRDPEVRDLLRRGDTSMDPQIRKDAYAKGLALIVKRAYALPLWSLPKYYVANEDLVFKPRIDGRLRFYEMSWK